MTVPVNVGDASGAKPEIEAPEGIVTVPVNVGEASGAFSPSAVVMPEAYDASSPMAAANSFKVSNAPGAPPIKSVTAPVTNAVVATLVLLSATV